MPVNFSQYQSVSANANYAVDIIFCIDATGSMTPIMDTMKEGAKTLYTQFREMMERKGKKVDRCRIKIIAFRDFKDDKEPLAQSPFYSLPEQQDAFESALNSVTPSGGGDAKENAWEAIATAIKSDWTTEGAKRRHVVVLMTDEAPLDLSERASLPNYPAGMPKTVAELRDWWNGNIKQGTYEINSGRLILVTPEKEPWINMAGWDRTWSETSKDGFGKGLADVNLSAVLAVLTNSI